MKKKIRAALAAFLLVLLLTACGGGGSEAPASYTVGEDEIISLDSILEEGEAMLSSIDSPTEAAIAADIAEYTYHYRQMEDPALVAAEYIAALRGGEQGFTMVDEENRRLAEDPDLETLIGSVTLAKVSAESGDSGKKLCKAVVAWSEFTLAIQVSHQPGTILPPPEPEREETPQPTALSEQLDYFNGLQPRDIGLEGDDMADYKVYPKTGWVLVDSFSCREINVYLEDVRDGSNAFMGTYYLSSDLQHLYQKTAEGRIVPLDLN